LYFLVPVVFLLLAYTLVSWQREAWFVAVMSHLFWLGTSCVLIVTLGRVVPARADENNNNNNNNQQQRQALQRPS
jgi:hypothetical protein